MEFREALGGSIKSLWLRELKEGGKVQEYTLYINEWKMMGSLFVSALGTTCQSRRSLYFLLFIPFPFILCGNLGRGLRGCRDMQPTRRAGGRERASE